MNETNPKRARADNPQLLDGKGGGPAFHGAVCGLRLIRGM